MSVYMFISTCVQLLLALTLKSALFNRCTTDRVKMQLSGAQLRVIWLLFGSRNNICYACKHI